MPYPKVPLDTYTCHVCGKTFHRHYPPAQPRTTPFKFCSDTCQNTHARSEEHRQICKTNRWNHVDGQYTVTARVKEVLR